MIGIGVYVGKFKKSWTSYWRQRKSLEYTERSGYDLLETKSGLNLNAKILPSISKIDTNNYLNLAVANFQSADSAGFVEWSGYFAAGGTKAWLFSSCDEATAGKNFVCWIGNTTVSMQVGGANLAFTNTLTAGTIADGWHVIRFASVAGKYQITIDGSVKTVANGGLTVAAGADDGKWLNLVTGRDNVSIGCTKRNTLFTSDIVHYTNYVNYNDTHKWYCTGEGIYVYDIVGTNHFTWTGSAHVAYKDGADTYLLDTGFSLYKKTGLADEYIPYASAGTPYAFSTSYTKIADYAGSATSFNKAPALIGFNETSSADSRLAFFDRSSATIYNAYSRTLADYDSTSLATKSRFHSRLICDTEMTQNIFNSGYQFRLFPVQNNIITQLLISGFVLTDKNMAGSKIAYAMVETKNQVFDNIMHNSVQYANNNTYKARSTAGKWKFNYNGTELYIKAVSTCGASFEAMGSFINVFIDGVYNQRVAIVAADVDYKSITLPAGQKVVELVEGVDVASTDAPANVLGTFIQAVKINGSFSVVPISTISEKVVFIGDSMTSGYKATIPASQVYSRLFEVENSKQVEILGWGSGRLFGIAGDASKVTITTGWVTSAFSNVSTTKKLVILEGFNDHTDAKTAVDFKAYYGAFLDAVHAADANIHIYCVSPLWTDVGDVALLADYRTAISELCTDRAGWTTYINGYTILADGTDFDADNIHPTTAGMKKVKDALYAVMYP